MEMLRTDAAPEGNIIRATPEGKVVTQYERYLLYLIVRLASGGYCPNCKYSGAAHHEESCHFVKMDEELIEIMRNKKMWE